MRRFLSIIRRAMPVLLIPVGIFAYFFTVPFLENQHLDYIRFQARNVVYLITSQGGGGTGFVVKARSGKTYILTNTHICRAADSKPLITIYRGDKYIVQVLKNYPNNDLCVVEAPSTASSSMTVAKAVSFGEKVYAIGHPLLEPITVTTGELSSVVPVSIPVAQNVSPKDCQGATYRIIDMSDNAFAAFFGLANICVRDLISNSSTVPILPGNSGSPIVNIYGNVVGVAFAAIESGVHSYVVPLEDIKDFLSSI